LCEGTSDVLRLVVSQNQRCDRFQQLLRSLRV
jgi:hypothetical protein